MKRFKSAFLLLSRPCASPQYSETLLVVSAEPYAILDTHWTHAECAWMYKCTMTDLDSLGPSFMGYCLSINRRFRIPGHGTWGNMWNAGGSSKQRRVLAHAGLSWTKNFTSPSMLGSYDDPRNRLNDLWKIILALAVCSPCAKENSSVRWRRSTQMA